MQKLLHNKDLPELLKKVEILLDEGYELVRSIQDLYCPVKEDEAYVPRSRLYVAVLEKRPAHEIKVTYDKNRERFTAVCGLLKHWDSIPEAAVGGWTLWVR